MTTICVPESLMTKIAAWKETSGASAELSPSEGRLRVHESADRLESTIDILEAGGWIGCATAWAMAGKHGLSVNQVGQLVNALDIRIKSCCLGCF